MSYTEEQRHAYMEDVRAILKEIEYGIRYMDEEELISFYGYLDSLWAEWKNRTVCFE